MIFQSMNDFTADTFSARNGTPDADFDILKDFPHIYEKGIFNLFGARPGTGGTTFMLQLAVLTVSRRRPVYFISPSDSAERIAERVTRILGFMPRNSPFFICDSMDISISAIEKTIKTEIREGAVFIDRADLIKSPSLRRLCSKLKAVAKENGLTVFTSLPLKRPMPGKNPDLSFFDAKYSEYADSCLILHRTPYLDKFQSPNYDPDIASVFIGKDRKKENAVVKIRWNRNHYTENLKENKK